MAHHSDSCPDSTAAGASPRPRDAKATKAEILATAERLFIDKGYANTSMSEIAEHVGIAKSLIYHHFGSKERLWEEVKTTTMRDYLEAQQALFAEGSSLAMLRDSAITYGTFLRDNSRVLRFNAWLALEGPQPDNPRVQKLVAQAVELIGRMQRQGELRDEIDPVHLIFTLIGVSEFWFANRKRASHVLAVERGGEEQIDWEKEDEQFLSTIVDVILRGAQGEQADVDA